MTDWVIRTTVQFACCNEYLVTFLLLIVHKLRNALIIPLHNLELHLGCALFTRHLA